jgi:phage terminase large subunit-like protein
MPVLKICAVNAVTEGSDSSVRRLSKKRSTGRIDGMVALAMALRRYGRRRSISPP